MKVEGPGKTSGARGVSKTGAKKSAGDAAFDSMIDEAESIEGQKPVSGVMSIGQLDALLSLQETADGTSDEAGRRGKKRGEELLAGLDQVRLGLLAGSIPQSTLQQLGRLVGAHREKFMDPKLADILDEIDLRVQVELAKLSRLL